jgi:hypothetical protein
VVGRDIAEIENSAFGALPTDCDTDGSVWACEALAAVGVATMVTSATSVDPAAHLEATFGPVVERLRQIEPSPLR